MITSMTINHRLNVKLYIILFNICYFLFFYSVSTILNYENYDNTLDVGCRKEEKYITPPKRVSGGVISVMNHLGFYVDIKQVIHRETPSGIILLFISLISSSGAMRKYFECVNAIGWDIICAIYLTSITIINDGAVSHFGVCILVALMAFFHLDGFHASTHKLWLCQKIGGLFHPKSQRWNNVLQNCDSQVVERQWRHLNQITTLKRLSKNKFNFTLFLIREYHNHKTLIKLKKKCGSTLWFEPLCNFNTLRFFNIDNHETNAITRMQSMARKDVQELIINHHKSINKIPLISRSMYSNELNIEYNNIFNRDTNHIEFNTNPIIMFKSQIIDKYNNNMQVDCIIDFIHTELCQTKCLCCDHTKYIYEVLDIDQMDIDENE